MLVDNRYSERGDLVGQRVQQGPARVVAGVTRAPPAMRAEEPLVDATVVGPREPTTPLGQLLDRGGRLAHHDLDDARIAEQVTLRVACRRSAAATNPRDRGAERGVDAARREHGVRVETGTLADHHDLGPRLMRGDRGADARAAGADHENIGRVGPHVHSLIHSQPGRPHQAGGLNDGEAAVACSFHACTTSSLSGDLRARLRTSVALYTWQLDALTSWLSCGRRGVVEAVTGSGKTDVAIAAAADALRRGRFVLVVVPSRVLMEQWHGRLRTALPEARIGRLGDSGRDDADVVRRARRDAPLCRRVQAAFRRARRAGC